MQHYRKERKLEFARETVRTHRLPSARRPGQQNAPPRLEALLFELLTHAGFEHNMRQLFPDQRWQNDAVQPLAGIGCEQKFSEITTWSGDWREVRLSRGRRRLASIGPLPERFSEALVTLLLLCSR